MCPSNGIYTGLIDGEHTFRVRAVDALGNEDLSEATYTWTVDASPPAAGDKHHQAAEEEGDGQNTEDHLHCDEQSAGVPVPGRRQALRGLHVAAHDCRS